MKKRLLWIVLPLVLLALLAAAMWGYARYDSTVHEYTLKARLSATKEPVAFTAGEPLQISCTAVSESYIPVLAREVVVLSVFDGAGIPVRLTGEAVASVTGSDVFYEGIQGHQAVYVSEALLPAGKTADDNALLPEATQNNALPFRCELNTEALAGKDVALQVDIFLLGKPQAFPYSQWGLLDHATVATAGRTASTIALPEFNDPTGFCWELRRNTAYLTGIGTITQEDIVLPTQVCLSVTDGIPKEDPIRGTCYDVVIASDAFFQCETIRSVTFAADAQVEDLSMCSGVRGMFKGCSRLEEVHNIPSGILVMDSAFHGCTAMTQTPVLPDFVVSMDYCFYGCTALERVGNLPQQVSALSNCFRGCSNLTEVPDLPPQAENLAYCFCQCTALTAAPAISPSVVNMTGCFSGCTGLSAAPALPDSALDLTECFMDCTGLTEVPVLPRQTVSLNSCFKNCTALTGSVQIPTKVINQYNLTILENAFSNCQSLAGITFECCTNVDTGLLIATVGMAEADIGFDYTYDHVKEGICDGCHMANGAFPANGVTVYADNIPADILLDFVDFVCEDVPAALKKTCRRLTVTPDLSQYDAKYIDDQWRGFARHPDGTSYVECDTRVVEYWLQWNPRFDMQDPLIELQSVTFHEMGHNFDTNFSPYFHHSSSAQWTRLFEEEGGVFGSYDNYEPHEYLRESFARAVSFYFTYPEECSSRCPGMYAYLDALFGEEAA